jgi:hypothetical protein
MQFEHSRNQEILIQRLARRDHFLAGFISDLAPGGSSGGNN